MMMIAMYCLQINVSDLFTRRIKGQSDIWMARAAHGTYHLTMIACQLTVVDHMIPRGDIEDLFELNSLQASLSAYH